LAEPWRSELPFWGGRVAEASHDLPRALLGYGEVLSSAPRGEAAELARRRIAALDASAKGPWLDALRARGLALLDADPARAKGALLPPASLGDEAAKKALRSAYRRLPAYDAVLRIPDYSDD